MTPNTPEQLRAAARHYVEQSRRVTDPEERKRLSELAFQLAQEAEALERPRKGDG